MQLLKWGTHRAPKLLSSAWCPYRARSRSKPSQAHSHVCCANQEAPYEAIVLERVNDAAELQTSCENLATHLEVWLNEEWTPLEVHRRLAVEAAEVYKRVRLEGEDDLGAVLLEMSQSLLSFNFRETFVDAFEVSNKVAELVMLQEDREVCCRSEKDQEQYARVEKALRETED